MSAVLEIRGLRKAFQGVRAVDDVSFDVTMGQITALVGPNGSGKTTTIDCICGVQRPDAGRVIVNGRDITGLPPHKVARMGLARTFQTTRLYGTFTVLEHVVIANQEFERINPLRAFLGGRSVREVERETASRGRQLLQLVGLDGYADLPAQSLSYGQRKLLALAAALISTPTLVVLDEPLAGVTPLMINEIEDAIRRFNESGYSFLIIEHNMTFVLRTCDLVIALDSGRKLLEGSPREVQADPRLLESYLGASVA
jgi:branched-chain amino acid transport system ATP-binding protein